MGKGRDFIVDFIVELYAAIGKLDILTVKKAHAESLKGQILLSHPCYYLQGRHPIDALLKTVDELKKQNNYTDDYQKITYELAAYLLGVSRHSKDRVSVHGISQLLNASEVQFIKLAALMQNYEVFIALTSCYSEFVLVQMLIEKNECIEIYNKKSLDTTEQKELRDKYNSYPSIKDVIYAGNNKNLQEFISNLGIEPSVTCPANLSYRKVVKATRTLPSSRMQISSNVIVVDADSNAALFPATAASYGSPVLNNDSNNNNNNVLPPYPTVQSNINAIDVMDVIVVSTQYQY